MHGLSSTRFCQIKNFHVLFSHFNNCFFFVCTLRPTTNEIIYYRFFSYSLEGRIIPRHQALIENRINFKLRYMLACTDEEFEKKVEAAVERRRRFESGVTDGTSSDSQVADDSSEEMAVVRCPESEIEFSDSQITDPTVCMRKLDSFRSGDSVNLSQL